MFGPAPMRTSTSHCALPTRLPWQPATAFASGDRLGPFERAVEVWLIAPGNEEPPFALHAASATATTAIVHPRSNREFIRYLASRRKKGKTPPSLCSATGARGLVLPIGL